MTRKHIIISGAATLLGTMLSLVLFAQTAGKSQAAEANKTIKVDVDLTLVNATVLERMHGRVVTDLKPDDFEV